MNAHNYQKDVCKNAVEQEHIPILNAACKEDPAKLGRDFGAINLDIWDFDEQTKTPLKNIANFVQGDLLQLSSLFEPEHFGLVVLGEFLEHCVYEAAKAAMLQVKTVLKRDGWLCVTFPLDDRPAKAQHAKRLLKVIVPGETGNDITVWHQTVWEDKMLNRLLEETGFQVRHRTELNYGFVRNQTPNGWGLLLVKR